MSIEKDNNENNIFCLFGNFISMLNKGSFFIKNGRIIVADNMKGEIVNKLKYRWEVNESDF
jgi:hypothetical protein